MSPRAKQGAQFVVVVLCALVLKLHYSTASPDQLRWVLGPATVLVELLSGRSFEFESYAGYMSSDHKFLIAASCAGVNFLITSFLMLSLRMLWNARTQSLSWRFIPLCALFAYVATIIANAVRIDVALRLQHLPTEINWLNGQQLHRTEGIFIYFGFLLVVFVLSEKMTSDDASGFDRRMPFALVIYYIMTLGIPLVSGSFKDQPVFLEHFGFVLLMPLVMVGTLMTVGFLVRRFVQRT